MIRSSFPQRFRGAGFEKPQNSAISRKNKRKSRLSLKRRRAPIRSVDFFYDQKYARFGSIIFVPRFRHRGAMSETRKLAAILVADVVGYSRLAGVVEDRILPRL